MHVVKLQGCKPIFLDINFKLNLAAHLRHQLLQSPAMCAGASSPGRQYLNAAEHIHGGENSQQFRLTSWYNDPARDTSGEALYIRDDESGGFWSPAGLPARGNTPDFPGRIVHGRTIRCCSRCLHFRRIQDMQDGPGTFKRKMPLKRLLSGKNTTQYPGRTFSTGILIYA